MLFMPRNPALRHENWKYQPKLTHFWLGLASLHGSIGRRLSSSYMSIAYIARGTRDETTFDSFICLSKTIFVATVSQPSVFCLAFMTARASFLFSKFLMASSCPSHHLLLRLMSSR